MEQHELFDKLYKLDVNERTEKKNGKHEIVLFDIGMFLEKMRERVSFFDSKHKRDKAIAYDHAAEFALYCILHGYGNVELTVSNINKMVGDSRTHLDEMPELAEEVLK